MPHAVAAVVLGAVQRCICHADDILLTHAAPGGYRVQAESYQPIPVFITIASIYLILTTAFTTLTSALEAKLEVGQTR